MTSTVRPPVAKPRQPEPEPERRKGTGRRTAPIQVDRELARMAAVVAAHRGITAGELVNPVLRPYLLAQYKLTQKDITQELDQQSG